MKWWMWLGLGLGVYWLFARREEPEASADASAGNVDDGAPPPSIGSGAAPPPTPSVQVAPGAPTTTSNGLIVDYRKLATLLEQSRYPYNNVLIIATTDGVTIALRGVQGKPGGTPAPVISFPTIDALYNWLTPIEQYAFNTV